MFFADNGEAITKVMGGKGVAVAVEKARLMSSAAAEVDGDMRC